MSQPVIFLACKVFDGLVRGNDAVTHTFLDYGLHSVPKTLNRTVQAQIDAVEQPSVIVLGYGLCGNGLKDIRAGQHTLIVPRADDCIAMFMGSRQRYQAEFHANPGTYYLTKGWLEVGSDPLSEYGALCRKYGEETADWLMEQQYQHYKRLVFVAHSQADLDTYRPRALEVAAYCDRFGMVFETFLGDTALVDQIAAALDGQTAVSAEFIVIPPGGVLTQAHFIDDP